jgi:signal transduction histidine kinase
MKDSQEAWDPLLDRFEMAFAYFHKSTFELVNSNRLFRKLFLISQTAQKEKVFHLTDFFPKAEHEAIQTLANFALKHGRSYDFDRAALKTNGSTLKTELWIFDLAGTRFDECFCLQISDYRMQKLFEKVKEEQRKTQLILSSIPDLLFAVKVDGSLSDVFSDQARKFFGESLKTQTDAVSLLAQFGAEELNPGFSGQLENVILTAELLSAPEQFEMVSKSAPAVVRMRSPLHSESLRRFRFSYSPLIAKDAIEGVLILASDETELDALRNSQSSQNQSASFESVHATAQFIQKSADYVSMLVADLQKLPEEEELPQGALHPHALQSLLRVLHTVKGGARVASLAFLERSCHRSETLISHLQNGSGNGEPNEEVEDFRQSVSCLRRFAKDLETLMQTQGSGVPLSSEARWLEIQSLLQSSSDNLCQILGKQAHVVARLNGPAPTKQDLQLAELSLRHLIANSIDHGLESPQRRMELGKEPRGLIQVDLFSNAETITLRFQDDGAGIDRARVLEKAKAREILPDDHGPLESLEKIMNILKYSGFSSKDEVTLISGRGVGFDAVSVEMEKRGGSFTLESTGPEGTCFQLRWPCSKKT